MINESVPVTVCEIIDYISRRHRLLPRDIFYTVSVADADDDLSIRT